MEREGLTTTTREGSRGSVRIGASDMRVCSRNERIPPFWVSPTKKPCGINLNHSQQMWKRSVHAFSDMSSHLDHQSLCQLRNLKLHPAHKELKSQARVCFDLNWDPTGDRLHIPAIIYWASRNTPLDSTRMQVYNLLVPDVCKYSYCQEQIVRVQTQYVMD